MLNKMNGYFKEMIGNKYLKLVPTEKSKEKIKKDEELWIKIKDLVRSVNKKSDDYDEKFIKIKLDSDDKLPLNKTTKISVMVIRLVVFPMYGNNNFETSDFADAHFPF